MRRVFGDAVISLGGVLVLLLTLVSIDPRVREQVSTVLNQPGSTATTISSQVGVISSVALSAAQDHSIANAPLLIFVVAASVLLLFMLRT
jgi:hypothetical protein